MNPSIQTTTQSAFGRKPAMKAFKPMQAAALQRAVKPVKGLGGLGNTGRLGK